MTNKNLDLAAGEEIIINMAEFILFLLLTTFFITVFFFIVRQAFKVYKWTKVSKKDLESQMEYGEQLRPIGLPRAHRRLRRGLMVAYSSS